MCATSIVLIQIQLKSFASDHDDFVACTLVQSERRDTLIGYATGNMSWVRKTRLRPRDNRLDVRNCLPQPWKTLHQASVIRPNLGLSARARLIPFFRAGSFHHRSLLFFSTTSIVWSTEAHRMQRNYALSSVMRSKTSTTVDPSFSINLAGAEQFDTLAWLPGVSSVPRVVDSSDMCNSDTCSPHWP